MKTELRVEGMTCQNCARHVQEALQSVDGVAAAQVDLPSGHATVRWVNGTSRTDGLLAALEKAGYPGSIVSAEDSTHDHPISGWQWNLILGGIITAGLMIGEWI